MGNCASTKEDFEEIKNETLQRRCQQRLNQNIVSENIGRDIKEFYLIDRTILLGKGLSGSVFICMHKETKMQYALKTLNKNKLKNENYDKLKEEIKIMIRLDHPNILRLHEYFETETKIYLILELCRGGELLDRLHEQTDQHYSEYMACFYVHRMFGAIQHCHANHIVHRDLKLENFLFQSDEKGSELKLIDFGLSVFFQQETLINGSVGSPYYVAPEVLSGSYDARCDVWSLGVITYMLLSGTPPFDAPTDQLLLKQVALRKYAFDPCLFGGVSDQAKDFIRCCFKDAKKRFHSCDALRHPWFNQLLPAVPSTLSLPVVGRLVEFSQRSKLTKVCLEVVSHSLSPKQIAGLRAEFDKLDRDGRGEVSLAELREAMKELSPGQLQAVLQAVGRDGDRVCYREFLAAVLDTALLTKKNMRVAFDLLAQHKSYITAADLHSVLGCDASWEEVVAMLRAQRFSAAHRISFESFQDVVCGTLVEELEEELPPAAIIMRHNTLLSSKLSSRKMLDGRDLSARMAEPTTSSNEVVSVAADASTSSRWL